MHPNRPRQINSVYLNESEPSSGGAVSPVVTIDKTFQAVTGAVVGTNANVTYNSASFLKKVLTVDGVSLSTWSCVIAFTTDPAFTSGSDALFVFPAGSITGTAPTPSPGSVFYGFGYPTVITGSDGRVFNANISFGGGGAFGVSLKDYIRPAVVSTGQIDFNFTF